MKLDQTGIEQLKAEACDRNLEQAPCLHLMPNFDALAWEWQRDAEIINGSICHEFTFFCDLADHNTFAIIKQQGGFFRGGTLFAGGMQIDSSNFIPDPDYTPDNKISIAGYCWQEDGQTWTLSNTSTIEDKMNEAWADCDDWLFGPCFFWDINEDGSINAPPPAGYGYCFDAEGGKTLMELPEREDTERKLFSLGFQYNNPTTQYLERLLEES